MLLVMCHSGAHRFAVDSRHVVEVLPRVALQPLPQSPDWLPGLLIHRGAVLPVLDLAQIAQGQPASRRLSNRVVVLEVELRGVQRRLGLLVERVGVREQAHVASSALDGSEAATALGQVLVDEQGVFQLVDPPRLVPEERQSVLFPAAGDI